VHSEQRSKKFTVVSQREIMISIRLISHAPKLVKLASSAAWTLSSAVYQWLILLILTNLAGLEEYGIFALAGAVFTPLFRLLSFSLREIASSNYSYELDPDSLMRIRIFTSLVAGLVSFTALTIIEPTHVWLIGALTALRILDAIYDLGNGFQQRKGTYLNLAISSVFRNVILPSLIAITLMMGGSPGLAFTIFLIASTIWYLIYDLRKFSFATAELRKAGRTGFSIKPTGADLRVLLYSTPLALAVFLAALNTSIPRFVAQGLFGTAEVGQLAALFQIALIFTPALVAVTQLLLPRLGRSYQQSNYTAFRFDAAILFTISVLCSVTIVTFSYMPFSVTLIQQILGNTATVSPELWRAVSLFAVTGYINAVLGPLSISQLKYRREFLQNIFSCVAILALSYLFGLQWGLTGIAYGAAAGNGLRTLAALFVIFRSTFKPNKTQPVE
jgi:O-antigen/teichoic acid export membrane protein